MAVPTDEAGRTVTRFACRVTERPLDTHHVSAASSPRHVITAVRELGAIRRSLLSRPGRELLRPDVAGGAALHDSQVHAPGGE